MVKQDIYWSKFVNRRRRRRRNFIYVFVFVYLCFQFISVLLYYFCVC